VGANSVTTRGLTENDDQLAKQLARGNIADEINAMGYAWVHAPEFQDLSNDQRDEIVEKFLDTYVIGNPVFEERTDQRLAIMKEMYGATDSLRHESERAFDFGLKDASAVTALVGLPAFSAVELMRGAGKLIGRQDLVRKAERLWDETAEDVDKLSWGLALAADMLPIPPAKRKLIVYEATGRTGLPLMPDDDEVRAITAALAQEEDQWVRRFGRQMLWNTPVGWAATKAYKPLSIEKPPSNVGEWLAEQGGGIAGFMMTLRAAMLITGGVASKAGGASLGSLVSAAQAGSWKARAALATYQTLMSMPAYGMIRAGETSQAIEELPANWWEGARDAGIIFGGAHGLQGLGALVAKTPVGRAFSKVMLGVAKKVPAAGWAGAYMYTHLDDFTESVVNSWEMARDNMDKDAPLVSLMTDALKRWPLMYLANSAEEWFAAMPRHIQGGVDAWQHRQRGGARDYSSRAWRRYKEGLKAFQQRLNTEEMESAVRGQRAWQAITSGLNKAIDAVTQHTNLEDAARDDDVKTLISDAYAKADEADQRNTMTFQVANEHGRMEDKIQQAIEATSTYAVAPGGASIQTVNSKVKEQARHYEPQDADARELMTKYRHKPNKSLLQRTTAWAKTFYRQMTREFEYLPPTERFGDAFGYLRRVGSTGPLAARVTQDNLRYVTEPLGKNANLMDDFRFMVFLNDAMRDIQLGKNVPGGLDAEVLKREFDAFTDYRNTLPAESKDALGDAYSRHMELMQSYAHRLVEAGILPPQVEENPWHFPHQVIDASINETVHYRGGEGLSARPGGYAQKRKGTKLPVVTDYIDVLSEYFARAERDLQTVRIFNGLFDRYGANEALKNVAKQAEGQTGLGGMTEGPFTGEEVASIRMAVRDLKQQAARDGKKFRLDLGTQAKIVEMALPGWECSDAWSPGDNPHVFFTAMAASERLYNAAIEEGLGVDPGKMRRVLAMGGREPFVVMPKPIVDTLAHWYKPHGAGTSAALGKAEREFIYAWKQYVLMNPMRLAKYNIRNAVGDLDGTIFCDPGIVLEIGNAARIVWKEFYSDAPLTPEVRHMWEQGIFSSGFSGQELRPEVRKLAKAFEAPKGQSPGQALKGMWKAYWEWAKTKTEGREALLRVAAYLRMKDQVSKGKKPHGVSNWRIIEGMTNKENLVGTLARDALGDYGSITVNGKWLRERLIPFWAWKEICLKRYWNGFANTIKEAKRSDNPRTRFRPLTRVATGLAARLFQAISVYAAHMIWNITLFPEQEKRLSLIDRIRMHLNFGTLWDGTDVYFRTEGSFDQLLTYLGAHELLSAGRDFALGRGDWGSLLGAIPRSAANELWQGLGPAKVAFETVVGKKTYPEVWNAREIHSRLRHVADAFSLAPVYDLMTGRPMRGLGGTDSIAKIARAAMNAVVYERQPGEYHYFEQKHAEAEFLEREYDVDKKAQALWEFKRALQYRDRAGLAGAAQKLMALEIEGKWDLANLKRSIDRMRPLSGMSDDKKAAFIESRTPSEKKRLEEAIRYYDEHVLKQFWRWAEEQRQ